MNNLSTKFYHSELHVRHGDKVIDKGPYQMCMSSYAILCWDNMPEFLTLI